MDVAVQHARPRLTPGRILPGALMLGLGMWAFLHPASFFDVIATYPPFNEHLLHDIGAFLAGLGVAWLAAVIWRDGWTVALAGNAAAAVLHAIGHVVDRDLGGRASDPWLLSAVAVLFVIPAVERLKGGAS